MNCPFWPSQANLTDYGHTTPAHARSLGRQRAILSDATVPVRPGPSFAEAASQQHVSHGLLPDLSTSKGGWFVGLKLTSRSLALFPSIHVAAFTSRLLGASPFSSRPVFCSLSAALFRFHNAPSPLAPLPPMASHRFGLVNNSSPNRFAPCVSPALVLCRDPWCSLNRDQLQTNSCLLFYGRFLLTRVTT